MPSAYHTTCRNQICAYHAFSVSSGDTIVALYTNAGPISIKKTSPTSWIRSILLCFSLKVSVVILILRQFLRRDMQFPCDLRVNIMRDGRANRATRTAVVRLHHHDDRVTRVFIRRERGEPIVPAGQ